MQDSVKHEAGDHVTFRCKTCNDVVVYEWKGRHRLFCPACITKRRAAPERRAQYNPHLKLKDGEQSAMVNSGLAGLALCSQAEAAAKLAVWEALEQAALGDGQVFVALSQGEPNLKPISTQAVQQIERRALGKIRRALRSDWEEYKESLAKRPVPYHHALVIRLKATQEGKDEQVFNPRR